MAPFDLKEEILRLKEERNAIILAHSYQTGDIQDMADYVGDSLGLAYKAQNTDCDVIAFCGVHFMAETAKFLIRTKPSFFRMPMPAVLWKPPATPVSWKPS